MQTKKRSFWRAFRNVLLGGITFILCVYIYLAWLLPIPDLLNMRPHGISSKIVDRKGNLLYEILAPGQGRKTYLKLKEMPPRFVRAVIAGEDERFYEHIGVDMGAIARALFYNYMEMKITSGASTITQQLVRNMLGTNRQRNLWEKLVETAYAIRISHAYTKDTVLEQYLNTVYFGNLSYGAGDAARGYFGKNLIDLDLAEMALLAGLPQSPTSYNPLLYPDKAKKRQAYILDRLVEVGEITEEEAAEARERPLRFAGGRSSIRAPHFVHYVISQLEEEYGPDFIHQGITIKTTLDLSLQEQAQRIVERNLERLKDKNVGNAAMLAATIPDGQVLVWLGSRNYFDDAIAGQVDIITSLRQPGSALKPFLYLLALEHGDNLATIIPDLPLKIKTPNGTYSPLNYDLDFHGPVRLKEALANSFNIPAVRMQEKIGTENFLNFLRRLGLKTLDQKPEYYGLALTLGGGEIRLKDLANAYLTLANYGYKRTFSTILSISDSNGKEIYTWHKSPAINLLGQKGKQSSALIIEALSDHGARLKSFGEGNLLELSVPAAAKTGTTRNFRDNWTFGFTKPILAGVWVGNSDASPMENISGIDGAGPIWHDFMEYFIARNPSVFAYDRQNLDRDNFGNGGFRMPNGMKKLKICAVSGLLPDENCEKAIEEWFILGTEPKKKDNFWQRFICNSNSSNYIDYPFPYDTWAAERGYVPPSDCRRINTASQDEYIDEKNSIPALKITSPLNGDAYEINHELPVESQKISIRILIGEKDENGNSFEAENLSIYIDSKKIFDEEMKISAYPQEIRKLWLPVRGSHKLTARLTVKGKEKVIENTVKFTVH